jgi:hypothetical protein
MKKCIQLVTIGVMGAALQAGAVAINVDQIIYENADGGNPAALAGTVNMTVSGSTLTIVLRNTSTATGATPGSFNLLTGLGFNLPTGVTIGSGAANLTAGSVGVNWNSAVLGNNVSGEWGYDNGVTAGPFDGVTTLDVNTAVSAMQASTDAKFSNTPLLPPTVLDGPEFGLLSAAVSPSEAGGLNAISDSITITLNLLGTWSGNGNALLNYINERGVVLSFASPDSVPGQRVPEGGSTAIMLGLALLGFGGLRRKLQK